MKSKEVKTRFNLAESSKESYGSRRAVLPAMMVMMMLLQETRRKIKRIAVTETF
jgi:uncharacterized membrane protein